MIPGSESVRKVLPLALGAALAVAALAAEAGADLAVSNHPELGEIVVDGAGNTLYVFAPDAQGESTCYETCAANWPPLVSDGEVTVGEGLSQDLVGAVTRTDGSEQVTYGGWPLYTFVRDTEAGQANGQGVNDAWFAIAPDGTPVGMPATEDAEGEGGEDAGGADGGDAGGAGGDDMAALMKEGAAVFARICAACHGANGDEALVEHAAILANNPRLENVNRVVRRIIHGGGYMPPVGRDLSDREVAAVATFVRNSFGNDFGPVGEEAAAEMR